MSTLVNFLQKNPAVLSKYVIVSTKLVDCLVVPLNKFMEHLLVVQGIDPKTEPGDKFQKEISAVVDSVDDSEDFRKDFDFGWVARHYEKTKSRMSNLTFDKFLKLTDLSHLNDSAKNKEETIVEAVKINSTIPESVREEILTPAISLDTTSIEEALKILARCISSFSKEDRDVKCENVFDCGIFRRTNDDSETKK
jgi:hypothetical protein